MSERISFFIQCHLVAVSLEKQRQKPGECASRFVPAVQHSA